MNYYFAPNIPDLRTEITLCNFASAQGDLSADLLIHRAVTDGARWLVDCLGRLEQNASQICSLPSPRPATGEMTLFFLYPMELDQDLATLPVRPDLMNTIPAWRANSRFASASTSVSFQGEYPDSMLKIPRGSLVSIGPMEQATDGVRTHLIFTNVREKPALLPGILLAKSMVSRHVIADIQIKSNQCNAWDITEIVRSTEEPLVLMSPDTAGIPLYFSHDAGMTAMSLEHTHPPITLTMFGNVDRRMGFVRQMKEYWLRDE